jgi:hypothetical protein
VETEKGCIGWAAAARQGSTEGLAGRQAREADAGWGGFAGSSAPSPAIGHERDENVRGIGQR